MARPTAMLRPFVSCLGLILAAPLLAACGTEPSGPAPAASAGWQSHPLAAELAADSRPVVSTAGDDVLVLTVSQEGALSGYVSANSGEFVAGDPLETGEGYLVLGDAVRLGDGTWFALGSGGMAGRGNDETLLFEPYGFRSADGLSWERVDVTGIEGPVDVGDMEVVGTTLVVTGTERSAEDPSMGGFRARAWTSSDGVDFAEVDLPGVPEPRGYRSESYAAHAALVGGTVLVAGRVGRSAAVWSSSDAGVTWSRVGDGLDAYDLSTLAVNGDLVMAGGSDSGAYGSTDAGATWAPVGGLPQASEEGGWAPVWAGGGRFWTLTGVDGDSWSQPEVCYADLTQCGRNPGPRLVSSGDGQAWQAVDLDGDVDAVVGTDDGRTVVLTTGPGGVVAHTLPAGATPPEADAEAVPERVDVVMLKEGQEPEVGVRYHAPMYLHCGMDPFWFGGSGWARTDDGPDIETGAGDDSAPAGWSFANGMLYGFATLVEPGRLEYTTASGDLIATYEPAQRVGGCA